MDTRPSISIDFDSTIIINEKSSLTSIYDKVEGKPTEGAKEVLTLLNKYFKLDVFSVRAKRPDICKAIEEWLKKEGIPFDSVSDIKQPSFVYIDNRAITFNGNWFEVLKAIVNFKSWDEKNDKTS